MKLTNEIVDERLVGRDIQRLGDIKNASTRLLWKCKIDGHEWMTKPSHIFSGYGCPKCSNHVPITNMIVDERIAGRNIQRLDDVITTHTKIRWMCLIDGHIWLAPPRLIMRGTGCPWCLTSLGEKTIARFLDEHKITYAHQKKFLECKNKKPLPFDFCIEQHKLLIEYQGGQHFEPRFTRNKDTFKLEQQQRNDAIKKSWAADNGYQLIYFTYEQTTEEIEQVLKSVFLDSKIDMPLTLENKHSE